jgi:hypothetical protein
MSRLVIDGKSRSNAYGRRAPTHTSGAPMKTEYWIEQLGFSVEHFDERGNLKEVLGRLHNLDAARAAYVACRAQYPAKIIYLCQGGRTLRRSDRDDDEMPALR